MNPRLWILLVLAGGLAVYLGVRTSTPVDSEVARERPPEEDEKIQLSTVPLECDVPSEPPQLSIRCEVPPGDKQVIHYFIDEAHGYYVESFDLEFYYKPAPNTTIENSPLTATQYVDNYLIANDTYRGCIYVTAIEMKDKIEHMGTTENWGARIANHGRYCAQNPQKLTPRSLKGRCLDE